MAPIKRKKFQFDTKSDELDILSEYNVKSLEDYFDKIEAGYIDAAKLVSELDKKRASNQNNEVEKLVKKEMEYRKLYAHQTEEEIQQALVAIRKQALEEVAKEEKKKRVQLALDVAKAELSSKAKQGKSTGLYGASQAQKEREERHKDNMELYVALKSLGKDRTPEQEKQLKEIASELKKEGGIKTLKNTMNNLVNSLNKLNSGIEKYAQYSAKANARLQGYTSGVLGINNYQPFTTLETRLTNAVGVSPYFKTELMLDNLQSLIELGIASNVEQRAFLQTAKDEIATTFDVANSALLRIIRLQQKDSTAARLGMEAYLTKFLNSVVANTEYLNSTFDSVQEALLETSSQMSTTASTELEFVIQKWLGALTGVGLSENTATSLAQALGYLGSGNIEALSGTNLQNLLVMASNRANASFGDILTSGLSASTADSLMRAIVEYMAEIGSSESNVVRSSFAQTFGLNVSDLTAAKQLSSSLDTITGTLMSYSDMYGELSNQLNLIPLRLNASTMIDTLWSNLEFGLSSNISKNPALAAIWKVTSLIQENTGGINIPFIEALGTGFDLNTTVENLIKLGVVGTSSLGMIGDLISGLSSTLSPSSILSKLGIAQESSVITRGSGLGLRAGISGLSTSLSTISVGNTSGEDIYRASLAGPTREAQETVKQTQESTEDTMSKVYELLDKDYRAKLDSLISVVTDIKTDIEDGVSVKVSGLESVLTSLGM